jgi:hypothetical protein
MDHCDFVVIVLGNNKDVYSIFLATHTSILDTTACLIGFSALCATVTLPLALRNFNPIQSSIKQSPKINFNFDMKFIFVSVISKYDSISLLPPLKRNEHYVYQVKF